jgi:hypothetical protein
MRANKSGPPPGGNGTTSVSARCGQAADCPDEAEGEGDCAWTRPVHTAASATTNRDILRAEDMRWVGKLKRSDRSNIGLLLCISSIPQKSIWVSMTSIINSALVYQHHVRTQTSDRKRKTILFDPSGHPRAHISPSLAEHASEALLLQSRHEIAISDEATKHKVGICQ